MLTKAQCYKTFCVRNLRMIVISWSVRRWQTFPAQSFGKGRTCRIENVSGTPLQGRLPCLAHKQQTRLGRLPRDKPSSLLRQFVNYCRKKFYKANPSKYMFCNIGHGKKEKLIYLKYIFYGCNCCSVKQQFCQCNRFNYTKLQATAGQGHQLSTQLYCLQP